MKIAKAVMIFNLIEGRSQYMYSRSVKFVQFYFMDFAVGVIRKPIL